MSRIANAPVEIPAGVQITLSDSEVTVKGTKGTLTRAIHPDVNVAQEDSALKTTAKK
jgi:large subunit ribosomal protein L6